METKVMLRASERHALLSLKTTSNAQEKTQNRLATGLKINSAIDAPEAFFQAKALNDRGRDFLERMDDINQTISLIMAAQDALDGVTTILQQMKGIVTAAATPNSADTSQFDDMLTQMNALVDDAYYQGTNLLANNAGAGEDVSTSSHKVEFSNVTDSELEIDGQYAGSSYYLSASGSTLVPDDSGSNLSSSGGSSTDYEASGSETLVPNTTANNQQFSYVTGLSNGNYVVTWTDDGGLDGAGESVQGRIFDADGNAVGTQFQINTTSFDDQRVPEVTSLEGGGFVVVFASKTSNADAFGQVFNADGSKNGSEFVIDNAAGSQDAPNVTGLKDGGFVITWIDHNSGDNIEAQVYDSSGSTVGSQLTVNTTGTSTADYNTTGIAALEDGGFVITWTDSTRNSIYARRYDSSSTAVGNDFVVNDNAGAHDNSTVVGLSGGGFVVAWVNGTENLVKGKIYDADGVSADGEVTLITPPGGNIDSLAYPRLTALSNGSFVVGVYDTNSNSGDVVARVYDSTGTAETALFSPHTATANYQGDIALGALENGGFVAVWTDSVADGDGDGIYMQRYSGKAAGEGSIGTVSSVDYDSGTITADVGGVSTTMTITKQGLGVANTWYYENFNTESGRSAALSDLNAAIDTVRSLSSRLGSQVSLLQVRSDYTEAVSENHSEGSNKLTQADINEEGANLLAMTTRSSLALQALTFLGNSVGSIIALFR